MPSDLKLYKQIRLREGRQRKHENIFPQNTFVVHMYRLNWLHIIGWVSIPIKVLRQSF